MANAPLVRKLNRAERALRPQNTAKQIDEIRAKIDEVIQALANLNTNVTGSTSGTSLAVAHAAWTGNYSTASADGVLDKYLRSDTTLKFPPALGTPTRVVTLSNDGTEGALLTADNSFAVNGFAIKAPNATNTLRVGKYGNLAIAGTALLDTTLMNFSKVDYNESSAVVRGLQGTVTNTGTGVGAICVALEAAATGTGLNAGGATTNPVRGIGITVTGGATSNNNFQGTVQGALASLAASAQTNGNSVTGVHGFTASVGTITHATVTDVIGFYYTAAGTSFLSGAVTNNYGVKINAIGIGTNRYGVNIAAITGGTIATGVEIATHSGGTTRRGLRSGNTNESTANDFLTSTQGKGFIAKDAQGTPHFWRFTVATDGTPSVEDTGTTAPTT